MSDGIHRGPSVLSFGLAGIALIASVSAVSAAGDAYFFDIPAESLGQALADFSKASGQQIIFSEELIGSRRTSGLTGWYTPDQAVTVLLRNTDLSAELVKPGVLMVRPAKSTQNQTGGSTAKSAAADIPGQTDIQKQIDGLTGKFGAPDAAKIEQFGSPSIEQVIVTGSRLVTNGNDMPTPVTVVAPSDLTATTPATVFDGLEALPEFAGSRSPSGNPQTSAANSNAHQLALRSLGVTRTLVMFDGRRLAPTDQTGDVDADEIPQMLLQRIDIVTGGASSVYGSDAVAGVVNFITDKHYNGIKLKAQVGESQYGDGKEEQIGIAGGMDLFDGKGHIEGSYEFYNNDGILGDQKNKRPIQNQVWTVQGAGSAANPYHLVQNTRISSTSFLGYITTANPASNPLRDMVFGMNGVLRPFNHGIYSGTSGNEGGGDGGYFDNATLEATANRNGVFGRFDYDINDNVSAFVEVTATKVHNIDIHQTNELRGFTYSATNAFLAPQYQAAMLASGNTTFVFSKMSHTMPTLDSNAWVTDGLFTTGLTGKWGDYKWDVSYAHSANRQTVFGDYNLDEAKIAAALDAVQGPGGQVVCSVTITNPGLYPGCVPLNEFGPTSESQDAINYIMTKTWYTALNSMDDVGGTISGSPFSDWAGPVEVALNGEYRDLGLKVDSNVSPTAHPSCVGLRFNCTALTPTTISFVVGAAARRDQSVPEGAIELGVPLLKDVPFIRALDFNGAARFTDYSTTGAVTTWKAGGTWAVNDEINFRITRSLDIRAPTLTELYAPLLVAPNGTTDFHTGFAGIIPQNTVSNPNLVPEEANTWTVGGVYRPEWLPDFSISIDYYKIKIGNAVSNIQGSNQQISNICEASGGSSPYCALAIRPLPFADHTLANTASAFILTPENVADVRTEGADIEANWQTDLLGPGHFAVRALASYQPELKTQNFPGAIITNAAGAAGLPSLRSTWFFKYLWKEWSLDVLEKFHDGTAWNSDRTQIYSMSNLPWAFYTNATITYAWNPAEIYLAVENLLNKQPTPYYGSGPQQGIPGLFPDTVPGDDNIGRYYTVGIRLKFN